MSERRFDEAVHSTAEKLLGLSGAAFFGTLALELTRWSGFDFALIGEIDAERQVEVLAAAHRGDLLDPFTYALAGTPCEQVIGLGVCAHPQGVRELFPEDTLLTDMAIEGYLATPLLSAEGRALGLIAVLHREKMEEIDFVHSLLRIFAHQTTAEIERRRALARVSALQSLHHQLLEKLPLDLVVFDLEGRFQYLNPHAVSDSERRRWLIGKTELDLVRHRGASRELAEHRQRHLQQVIATSDVVHYEESLERDGQEKIFMRSLFPAYDHRGELCQVVGFGFDVTEQKEIERNLRENEAAYRAMFEDSSTIKLLVDPRTTEIVDANAAACEFYGHSRDELKRKRAAEIAAGPAEQVEEHLAAADRGELKHFQTQHLAAGGEVRDVEVRVGRIEMRGKKLLFAIIQDISEQRRLEEQFRQSQKMEAVGRLAGGLAHDFNNLLTAINGYGELLQHQLPEDDPRRTFVDEICGAGRRAADLTAKLLTLSRRKAISPRVVDVNRMVRQLQNLLRRLIGEDIDLTTELEPTLYPVRVDPGQMEQVLLNLAINARDAMPTGGRLTLTTRNVDLDERGTRLSPHLESGPHVHLMISDTGVGMDAAIQQHIFEPFFTTKAQGKGTGLGLSTAYATIQQSGGHISVESSPDQGTIFHILLPAVDAELSREERESGLDQSQMGSETILLVEDDAAVRRLVRRILEQQGYRVIASATPADALSEVARHGSEIDLLVTDVIMPAMSGPDLAAQIRRLEPGIRILFISGYTDDKFTGRHGLLGGEHDILQKPFNAFTLSEKVREILDQPVS